MDILRQTLYLPYKFPGANQYLKDLSYNRYLGGSLKKQWTDAVIVECKAQKLRPYNTPVVLSFTWFEPNKRRDPDNIVFGKKFILDGIVRAGIIPDDSQEWIWGFGFERWLEVTEKDKVGVLVLFQEANDLHDEQGERNNRDNTSP